MDSPIRLAVCALTGNVAPNVQVWELLAQLGHCLVAVLNAPGSDNHHKQSRIRNFGAEFGAIHITCGAVRYALPVAERLEFHRKRTVQIL